MARSSDLVRGLAGTRSCGGANSLSGTYQCYLTRQPGHLRAALQHAEASGYALGIKLVRGAYFVQERKRWKDDKRVGADPIWPE